MEPDRRRTDTDLEIGELGSDGVHALVLPCRRTAEGWIEAGTEYPVEVKPTHWRHWGEQVSRFSSPR